MAETEKKFSELTAAAVLTDADIFAISQIDSATASLMSKRTTLIAIANKLASLTNYTSELTTQDKTLTGAINELKGLISLIPHFGIEVVQTLPTEDISETTIYMTPSQNPQTQDAYDEFIYVNDAWEHVGSTAVDLSAYYTKLETDALLATKANTADVSAALALKENTADMEDDVTDIVVDLTDTQETAEGNPVTLQTVQEGYAKAVTIKLTPKQDLHGYDKPWPGGGGKNQFDIDNATFYSAVTVTDGVVTMASPTAMSIWIPERTVAFSAEENTQYTLSARMKSASANNIGIAILYTDNTVEYGNRSDLVDTFFTSKVTSNPAKTIASFGISYNTTAIAVTIEEIQIELGATATAYEPYANICPIEGYEEASATRTGKNLVNLTGIIAGKFETRTFLKPLANTITVSARNNNVSVTTPVWRVRVAYQDGTFLYVGDDGYAGGTFPKAFTANSNNPIVAVTARGDLITSGSYDIQVELGNTATEYEPYDGATATAEFPETIYGATGDAAGGDWGKTYPKIDLGTLTYTNTSSVTSGKSRFSARITGIKRNTSTETVPHILCDQLEAITPTQAFNNNDGVTVSATDDLLILYVDKYASGTAADFKTAMSGVELAYELATPEPFQTAPSPLTLRKGDNKITTDCDSVKVKYNKLALPDIGGIGRYISALEARVVALEGNGNRSLSLMKSAPIETKEEEPTEEPTEAETEEEAKNENTSEIK